MAVPEKSYIFAPANKQRGFFPVSFADMAQLVEQRIRNAWVGGSSPPIGSSIIFLCGGISISVVRGLPKPERRVRFPYSAHFPLPILYFFRRDPLVGFSRSCFCRVISCIYHFLILVVYATHSYIVCDTNLLFAMRYSATPLHRYIR